MSEELELFDQIEILLFDLTNDDKSDYIHDPCVDSSRQNHGHFNHTSARTRHRTAPT